jgi:glutathione S-transferase
MRLLTSPTSPFARKIQVLALELGLSVEVVNLATLPTKTDAGLKSANPLGKLPTLILDSGETLFDSRVISEYLCTLVPSHTMIAALGAARFATLRTQALADGVTDAAVSIRYETFVRPPEKVMTEWLNAQEAKIAAGLDALEQVYDSSGQVLDLGSIATVCALDYLTFRTIGPDPYASRPALRSLQQTLSARVAFSSTVPVG